jgi:hypothetical protein
MNTTIPATPASCGLNTSRTCREESDTPHYRTVKGILTAGTETEPGGEPDEVPTAPAHLHGPQALFETGEAS